MWAVVIMMVGSSRAMVGGVRKLPHRVGKRGRQGAVGGWMVPRQATQRCQQSVYYYSRDLMMLVCDEEGWGQQREGGAANSLLSR